MTTLFYLTTQALDTFQVKGLDYSSEWSKLWEVESSAISAESGTTPLTIIWNPDVPLTGGMSVLEPHLTPLDWVLAKSLLALRQFDEDPTKSETEIGWIATRAINIIDIGANLDRDTFADTMVASLLGQMPWVRLFSPLALGRSGYHDLLTFKEKNLPAVNSLLLAPPSEREQLKNNVSRLKALNQLNRTWAVWVEGSDDHHDLNNLVGAQLFSGETTSNATKALLNRLTWSDLGTFDAAVDLIDSQQTTFDIVVVDDQIRTGWGKLFERMLGRSGSSVLKAAEKPGLYFLSSPSELCCELKLGALKTNDSGTVSTSTEDIRAHYGRRVFDSPVEGGSVNTSRRPWALVLDLRFFIGVDREEEEWYRFLARAFIQISGCDGLAWGGLVASELSLLHKIADGTSMDWLDDSVVALKLSLFPRICALRWPTVPIILFSTTSNRALIASLSSYSNIFIAAPKPNILGLSANEEIKVFALKFKQELLSSHGLIELQQAVLDCCAAVSQNELQPAIFPDNKHYQLVCALDESGNFETNRYSAVGAIILVASGSSEIEAAENSKGFQEHLRCSGVNFYAEGPYYHESNSSGATIGTVIAKKTPIGVKLSSALQNYSRKGEISLVGVCTSLTNPQRSEQLFRDNVFLTAVRQLVTVVLCEWLPCVGFTNKDKVKLAFWFADKQTSFDTRSLYQQEIDSPPIKPADISLAKQHAKRLDFRVTFSDGVLVESIGGRGSAYQLVQAALAGRSPEFVSNKFKQISTLQARKLVYSTSKPNLYWNKLANMVKPVYEAGFNYANAVPEYTVIANLTDAALKDACFDNKSFPSESEYGGVNNLTVGASFSVTADDTFSDFLEASRQIDDESLTIKTEALKTAYKRAFFLSGLTSCNDALTAPITTRLVKRVLDELGSSPGMLFAELANIRVRFQVSPSSLLKFDQSTQSLTIFAKNYFSKVPLAFNKSLKKEEVGKIIDKCNISELKNFCLIHKTTEKNNLSIKMTIQNDSDLDRVIRVVDSANLKWKL